MSSFSVYSQVIDIGAKWTFDTQLAVDPEIYEGWDLVWLDEIVSDTIIDNKTYFVFANHHEFLRIEGQKWYRYGRGQEHLLFDFSLGIGDTLKIYSIAEVYGIDSLWYLIEDVSTLEIDGIDFKVQHIKELTGSAVLIGNKIIENMGASATVLPLEGGFIEPFPVGLRCVDYSDGFEVRLADDGLCTNIFTSTEDLDRNELTISPNPCKDIMNIETKGLFDKVEIYDSAGLLVLQKKFQSQLFIDHLTQGLFVVKLSNKNTAIYKKIMKL